MLIRPRKVDVLLCINARLLKNLVHEAILLTFFHMKPIYLNSSKIKKILSEVIQFIVFFWLNNPQSLLPGNKCHQSSSTNQSYLECPMNRLFEVKELAFPVRVKFICWKSTIMNLRVVGKWNINGKMKGLWR